MAAGATVAATITHLSDATVQLQKLLKATEAALDTADKLKTSGNRWLRLFKPVLTARAHYKEALSVYAVAIETITPCIDAMDPEDALGFLQMANRILDLRKDIYENNSYNRKQCIKLLEDAHVLRENAGRSKDHVELKQLQRKIKLTTIYDDLPMETPPSVTHSGAATSSSVVDCKAASRNPFLDFRDPLAATTSVNPDTPGSSTQAF
ncbi:hypothetical protein V8D89_013587 [Ganoderma adspersum]